MRNKFGLFCLILVLHCGIAAAEEPQVQRKSFLGQTPPEIVAEDEHWLGPLSPVTLAGLNGKVVWLQFNF